MHGHMQCVAALLSNLAYAENSSSVVSRRACAGNADFFKHNKIEKIFVV